MSLEEKIEALTAAVIANTAAQGKAPKATKAKGETESTQPAANAAVSAPASAPANAPTSAAPAASSPPPANDAQLLSKTTEAVLKLANEYSREKAVGILAARKVTRCSDLKPGELQTVLNEALAEIAYLDAAKQAAAANASLV